MKHLVLAALLALGCGSAAAAPVTLTPVVPVAEPATPTPVCGKRPCVAHVPLEGQMVEGTASAFEAWLRPWEAAAPDAWFFFVNSPGGNFDEAHKMVRLLGALKAPVHCLAGESVASSAFWLFQACDHRAAGPLSLFMIHEVFMVFGSGTTMTQRELLTAAEDVRVSTAVMTASIAKRMGLPVAMLATRLAAGEWHMVASEALEEAAIDSIFEGSTKDYLDTLLRTLRKKPHGSTP